MKRTTPLRPDDPRTVGQYTLLGRLGSGGMGVVFLAEDRGGRPVAVKMVHPHLAGDDEFRRRFRSEVEGARRVPPFCTAEVLDADPDASPPYLVVEYVDGPSLAETIELYGPLSTSNLHALAVGVATALTVIHEAGIIHRDLKPDNVLLSPGSPKVIDFGIARALDATSQHTRTGHMVGTVAYMAPERFAAEGAAPLTAAADIFAWGCVVAFAGTGRSPFSADTPPATAMRILTQPPELGGLSAPLRGLVELALVTDPQARPTARQLLDMLLGSGHHSTSLSNVPLPVPAVPRPESDTTVMQRQMPPEVPGVAPRADSEPPRRTRRVLIGVLAGVAALALLVGGGAVAIAAGVLDDGPSTPGAADGRAPASAGTSAPAAFSLPPGKPFVVDALTSDGQWTASEIVGEEASNCGVGDGALRVHRVTPGSYACDGPHKEISGDLTIAVTGRMEQEGTCLAVWLYFADPSNYELRACPTYWQLSANINGGTYTVRRIDTTVDPLPLNQPIRLQVLVRDDVVTFGHDGVQVGESPLPEESISQGRALLGLVTDPGDESAPWAASFNDFEVNQLSD